LAKLNLKLENGKTTSLLRAMSPLRMRVNMSEIVSFIINLPRSLYYSRNFTIGSQLTETNTADVEVAHITVFAAAAPATTHNPSGVLGIGSGPS
jgi:hypothetical protein